MVSDDNIHCYNNAIDINSIGLIVTNAYIYFQFAGHHNMMIRTLVQKMLCRLSVQDVDFFSKKIILCAKGGDFRKGALDSDFMFVNIEPYKSKKCVPY